MPGPLLAPLALAALVALDGALAARPWPTVVEGLLDEPAHLLTAGLLLQAFAPRMERPFLAGALCGAVLIDLDHIPLYLWPDHVTPGGGRPVTHSLATVLSLLAVALLASGRPRAVLAGGAGGVTLHLLRDLASEPGVPLVWPVTSSGVQLPYRVLLAVLVVAAIVAVLRSTRGRISDP